MRRARASRDKVAGALERVAWVRVRAGCRFRLVGDHEIVVGPKGRAVAADVVHCVRFLSGLERELARGVWLARAVEAEQKRAWGLDVGAGGAPAVGRDSLNR